MTNNKVATDVRLDHSWNLRWYVPYYKGMPDSWRVGQHGHRYVNRKALAQKLRTLRNDIHVEDIHVIEHSVLSEDELIILMSQEEPL